MHTVVFLVTTHKKATRMQVHSNAATNKKQRERLQGSKKTYRALAEEMVISLATVHRWKQRTSPEDQSCRPHEVHFAFDEHEQAMLLSLRQKGLPLDDLVDLFYRKNRRIGGKTPYEAALFWYAKNPSLFIREPTALLVYRKECSQSTET